MHNEISEVWSFAKFEDQVALVDEFGNSVSYAELEIESNRLATLFQEEALSLLYVKIR